ncbi:MAG TPA: FMN-binding negative transcriptional regulator [Thermoanaerobaculia bacterium]|nr:FMN-binding negative transcriptional regulator [Thermoanaerobaculia bacterium]
MFVRPCWRPQSAAEIDRLIDENPWALLVNNGDDGPLVTNLPLLLDRSRGPQGTLLGHLARQNEHAAALFASTSPALAVFHGPYSYVTPSWYPNRDMPGTYYYTAVHCYGRPRRQSEAALLATLRILNDRMEGPIPSGWKLEEVPPSEIARRLPNIVGFEMEIERIEAKFKLGQDEPRKDALAVAGHLIASSDPSQRILGEAVRRANLHRTE